MWTFPDTQSVFTCYLPNKSTLSLKFPQKYTYLMDLYTDTVAHLHPLPPTSHTHSYMHMLSHLFNRQHANTRITHVWSISHTGTSSLIHTACMLIHTHMCINTDTAKSLMLRPGHDNAFTFRQDHIHIHAHNLSHTDTHIFTHSCT